MSRLSNDEFDGKGNLVNGFDYDLQVWVKGGLVLNCGHPAYSGSCNCNARRFVGMDLDELKVCIEEGVITA